jgi:hypothetical protein
MRNLWVPAVNNAKRFGRWRFLELKDAPYDAATLIRQTLSLLPFGRGVGGEGTSRWND